MGRNSKKCIRMFTSDVETCSALMMICSLSCRVTMGGMPDDYGYEVPHKIGWVMFGLNVLLWFFLASETILLMPDRIEIGYLYGIISKRYQWDTVHFYNKVTSGKKTYISVSVKTRICVRLFPSTCSFSVPYSEPVSLLIGAYFRGCISPDFPSNILMDDAVSDKINSAFRKYSAIRITVVAFFVLMSVLIMIPENTNYSIGIASVSLLCYAIYTGGIEPDLDKLKDAYFELLVNSIS